MVFKLGYIFFFCGIEVGKYFWFVIFVWGLVMMCIKILIVFIFL